MGGTNYEHACGRHYRVQKDLALRRHFKFTLTTFEALAKRRVEAPVLTGKDIVVPVLQPGAHQQSAAIVARFKRALNQRQSSTFFQALDEHADLSTARQTHLPGGLVCDADCDDTNPWMSEEDLDGDGYSTCAGDCEAYDHSISPDAFELCNGKDDDCDGLIDEDFTLDDADTDGIPDCRDTCIDLADAPRPQPDFLVLNIAAIACDLDHDGLVDLYIGVDAESGDKWATSKGGNPLWTRSGGGAWQEQGQTWGIAHKANCVCVPAADFDNDGDLDLLLVNFYSNVVLYRNETNDKNWLRVKAIGTKSNPDGIGARIKVFDGDKLVGYRQMQSGADYCRCSPLEAHLGLGKKAAATYRDILGPSNFFLEMQYQGIDDQKVVNTGLLPIARDLNLPLVCTNDVHYLKQTDSQPHDVLLCIGTGKSLTDEKRLKYHGDQFFLKTGDEMAEVFGAREAAIAKELTKLHESVARGTPAELAAKFDSSPELKGEFVVLVGPPSSNEAEVGDEAILASLKRALRQESFRDAVRSVAAELKVKRSRVYDLGLALERKGGERP